MNNKIKLTGRLLRYVALAVLLSAVSGCTTVNEAKETVSSWINPASSTDKNTAPATVETKPASENLPTPLLKYAATLRVNQYDDRRKSNNAHLLGLSTKRIQGSSGNQLLLDQEIANIVTMVIKKRFDTEGYQVLEGDDANRALFEVSGVIRDLTMNVKDRDEINIVIDTTLKEIATGKEIWSGQIAEKNERFAGIYSKNMDEVIAYLNKMLRIVSNKTIEAASASLKTSQPEMFNLTPTNKPAAPDVPVYIAPAVVKTAPTVTETAIPAYSATQPPVNPVQAAPANPVSQPANPPRVSPTAGFLRLNTKPQQAKVYLDNTYYGLSPLRLEMEPGVHVIAVKLEGYKLMTEKVSIRKGDNIEIELNLNR
jgi:hypothetical protein